MVPAGKRAVKYFVMQSNEGKVGGIQHRVHRGHGVGFRICQAMMPARPSKNWMPGWRLLAGLAPGRSAPAPTNPAERLSRAGSRGARRNALKRALHSAITAMPLELWQLARDQTFAPDISGLPGVYTPGAWHGNNGTCTALGA
jgi:hypothetical protein